MLCYTVRSDASCLPDSGAVYATTDQRLNAQIEYKYLWTQEAIFFPKFPKHVILSINLILSTKDGIRVAEYIATMKGRTVYWLWCDA